VTLVWLPDARVRDRVTAALNGELPPGIEVDLWDGRSPLPPGIADVELFVLPYMVGPPSLEPVPRMTRLRLLQTQTAGYEDVLGQARPGLRICNAPGVHDASTAELAVGLAVAGQRGFADFVRAQGRGEWASAWRPSLADSTVLIVGYGSVGAAVERRLAGFEVSVVRVASRARGTVEAPVHGVDELPRLLPSADVVILCVPLTPGTRGLVDAAFLGRMKDGALLVNVARGPVVDTAALVAELRSGRLRAAVDVTDPEPLPPGHPLWSEPNLLLTPHVGGATSAFEPRAARFLAEQLRRFAAGEALQGVVAGP
jgi:phosphoglycerate dehydrogenase-like enzyme